MRGRIFSALSAFSALLFVLVMVMWVRSYHHRGAWRLGLWGHVHTIFFEDGKLGFDNKPEIEDFEQKRLRDIEAMMVQGQEQVVSMSLRVRINFIARYTELCFRSPPAWVRYSVRSWIPALIAAALTAILPALWCMRFHRRRLRVAMGHCAACGYDLRATPQHCPECGLVPSLKHAGTEMRR